MIPWLGTVVVTLVAASLQATEEPGTAAETPLRVVVTIAREAPDKKPVTESLELHVVTGKSAQLKVKTEMPIAVQGSFQYRAVGTDIECQASEAGAGRYLVETKVSHDFMYRLPAGDDAVRPGDVSAQMPLFRTIEARVSSIYSDGQTSDPVMARDLVSGEISRVKITVMRIRQ